MARGIQHGFRVALKHCLVALIVLLGWQQLASAASLVLPLADRAPLNEGEEGSPQERQTETSKQWTAAPRPMMCCRQSAEARLPRPASRASNFNSTHLPAGRELRVPLRC